MGAWGPALFSDDLACDVRDGYRELLEDGVADDEALARTLAAHRASLADADDEPIVVLALAVTASKLGRLPADLRDRALAILDAGRGVERWDDDPKLLKRRVAALEKVRNQLLGEQPARKKVRPPSRHVTSLVAGDILVIELRPADFMALRVVRVHDTRYFVAPTVQVLDWRGREVPDAIELRSAQDLPPRPPTKGAKSNPWWFTRGTRLGRRGRDFGDVGFQVIGAIDARPGDSDARLGSMGNWQSLADVMRKWTAD